ncbi:Fasciclin domain containing protein [Asbolus verrucosus]|uniref:Fasciclin domain containing protein n=1 Tax=Asbolus verrucosus TaxID=1661398 RepID=A0A482VZY7_ASBVE|nr:Fasciclin domain containing protein [Asbolus verrucosus]
MIDRVLDPMVYTSSYPNPTAYTFLSHHYKWKIGSRNVMNFLHKVQLHGKDDLYRKGGGHTFFVPIDHKTDDYKWENIDGYIIEGHVVPNMVLFTRPTQRNFIFETAANGDYIYIVLSLVTSGGKDFVKSHTILGNSNHKKGEVLSEIVKANIPVANGVVHLIKQPLAVFDRELKPFPYLPVFYKVASDPNLSHTFNIGRRNRMNKIFKNESALYTFFVPTNRAWRNYLNYTHHEQGQILKRHVVVSDSRLSMAKLAILSKNGGGEATLNTLDGTIKLTVTQKNGTYSMTWNNRSIELSRPDYECSNGVVHVLDDVLADVRTSSDTSHDSERVSFWGALKNLVL